MHNRTKLNNIFEENNLTFFYKSQRTGCVMIKMTFRFFFELYNYLLII
jgi:hypothetical protein